MTRVELSGRFPTYTVRQDPDPNCHACKGGGVLRGKRSTLEAPCFCAVSDMPHGPKKTEIMKAIGRAAKSAREDMGL